MLFNSETARCIYHKFRKQEFCQGQEISVNVIICFNFILTDVIDSFKKQLDLETSKASAIEIKTHSSGATAPNFGFYGSSRSHNGESIQHE